MSDTLEWRRLYGARETLFCAGEAVGDFYLASGDVWRVRLWPQDRLQGGRERLVLSEDAARTLLVAMLERARRESTE
jgi:hypothetical protein